MIFMASGDRGTIVEALDRQTQVCHGFTSASLLQDPGRLIRFGQVKRLGGNDRQQNSADLVDNPTLESNQEYLASTEAYADPGRSHITNEYTTLYVRAHRKSRSRRHQSLLELYLCGVGTGIYKHDIGPGIPAIRIAQTQHRNLQQIFEPWSVSDSIFQVRKPQFRRSHNER